MEDEVEETCHWGMHAGNSDVGSRSLQADQVAKTVQDGANPPIAPSLYLSLYVFFFYFVVCWEWSYIRTVDFCMLFHFDPVWSLQLCVSWPLGKFRVSVLYFTGIHLACIFFFRFKWACMRVWWRVRAAECACMSARLGDWILFILFYWWFLNLIIALPQSFFFYFLF